MNPGNSRLIQWMGNLAVGALCASALVACQTTPEVKEPEREKTLFERLDADFNEAITRKDMASRWHGGFTQALPLKVIGPVFEIPAEQRKEEFSALRIVLKNIAREPSHLNEIFGEGFSDRFSRVDYQGFSLDSEKSDQIAAAFGHAYRNEVTLNAIFDADNVEAMEIAVRLDREGLDEGLLRINGYKTVAEAGRDRNSVYYEINGGAIPQDKKRLVEKLYKMVAAALAISIPEYASINRQLVLDTTKNHFATELPDGRVFGHVYNSRVKQLEKERADRLAELDVVRIVADSKFATDAVFSADGDKLAYALKANQKSDIYFGSAKNFEQRQQVRSQGIWDGWAHRLGFTHSGELIVIDSNRVSRWNPVTGEWVYQVETIESLSADFDKHTNVVLLGHETGVSLHSIDDGRQVFHREIKGLLSHVALSANGKHYAVVSEDKQLNIYSTTSGGVEKQRSFDSNVTSITFSKNAGELFLGFVDGQIAKWSYLQDQFSFLYSSTGEITSLSLSTAGDYLASRSREGYIEQWDIKAGSSIGGFAESNLTTSGITMGSSALSYSADGNYLLYGGVKSLRYRRHETAVMVNAFYQGLLQGKKRKNWVDTSYQHVYAFPLSELDIKRLQQADLITLPLNEKGELPIMTREIANDLLKVVGMILPDPMLVASRPEIFQNVLNIESITTEMEDVRLVKYAGNSLSGDFYAVSRPRYRDWGYYYQVLGMGRHGFIPNAFKSVRIGEMIGSGGISTLASGANTVYVSPEGGDVKVIDVDEGDVLVTLKHAESVLSVVGRNDVDLIITGGSDGMIRVWESEDSEQVRSFTGYTGRVASLLLLDEATVLSGSSDKTIKVWDFDEGKPKRPAFLGHTDTVVALSYNADNDLLVSAGDDPAVRVWRFADGAELHNFSDMGSASSFSYDDQGMVVGYQTTDGNYVVRSIKNGEVKGRVKLADKVNAAALFPDGNLLLTATDHRIGVWNIATGENLDYLESNVDEPVTHIAIRDHGELALVAKGKSVEWWNVGWYQFQVERGW